MNLRKWKVLWEVPKNLILNKKYRTYYRWLIHVRLKMKFGIVHKELTIITPSYNYEKRSTLLHRAIDSIHRQAPHSLKVKHLVVFDGEAPASLHIESPKWCSREILETPRTAMYGALQRNTGLARVQKGWLLFLDDDNTLEPDALAKIEKALTADSGVIVFRVYHAELKKYVPENLQKVPQYADIDSLSFVVNADIAQFAEWQHKYHHDYLYIQNIIGIGEFFGYRTKVNEAVIGTHY